MPKSTHAGSAVATPADKTAARILLNSMIDYLKINSTRKTSVVRIDEVDSRKRGTEAWLVFEMNR